MKVRMVLQVLAPGVEHADEADLGAEMLRIGGDRAERLGRRPEQNGVDRSLVLERDLGCGRRQGENDVEIQPGPAKAGGTGSSSACRSTNQAARADPGHFGQWRSRHEL